jgi:hypothetical protein
MTDRHDQTKRAAMSNELAAIFAALEKINHRLDQLEKAVPRSDPQSLLHPSQERFTVAEAIADEIFANFKKEKACTFEPNGKPCDHCGMCSSRGF